MTPEELFDGHPLCLEVLRWATAAVPDATVRTTRSQAALRRRRAFAWVWRPGQYLARPGANAVLTVALGRLDPSPRWKQIAHPSPGQWVHHLEVHAVADLDDEAAGWLREAAARAA